MRPDRLLLRALLIPVFSLRRLFWRLGGRRGPGVLAVPLTPQGKLVLLRLTYARGWRLPGGGIDAGEEPREAALRELAEEIGMTDHGEVACVDSARPARLFVVRDVRYTPRRTLEVESVAEFPPDALPAGATPLTRRKIADAMPLLVQGHRTDEGRS